MLTLAFILASIGQCSGGSCALPQAGYAPQFQFAVPTYAAPAPPRLYRLSDADGAGWVHTDPAYLRSWIAARDAAILKAKAAPKPTAPAPKLGVCPCCEAGGCPCSKATTKTTALPSLSGEIVAVGTIPPELH